MLTLTKCCNALAEPCNCWDCDDEIRGVACSNCKKPIWDISEEYTYALKEG